MCVSVAADSSSHPHIYDSADLSSHPSQTNVDSSLSFAIGLSSPDPLAASSWCVCMQQYGSDEAANGERPPLPFNTSSPLPVANSRVRRFAQERRALPHPRVMVVFSAASETEKPGDAMSSSDSAEDDFRKPSTPAPNLNLGKSLRSTFNASQEVRIGVVLLLLLFILGVFWRGLKGFSMGYN